MDNQPQSDDIILPETGIISEVTPSAPPARRRRPLVIVIVGVALLAITSSLIYIFTRKEPEPTPATTDDEPAPVFKYDIEQFSSALALAEARLEVKDYTGVEFALKDYSLPERMTSAQKYRYYSLRANLYSAEHLSDATLAQQYTALAEAALNSLRKGEE